MAYTCGAQNRFCGLERRAILTAASFPPSLHRPQDALGEKPWSLTLVRAAKEAVGSNRVHSMKKSTGQKPCGFFCRSDGIRSHHIMPIMYIMCNAFKQGFDLRYSICTICCRCSGDAEVS